MPQLKPPPKRKQIMELSNNTVLITGGGSGIGLAFAERFVNAGSEVIICGRREKTLAQAKERVSALRTYVCDLADASERVKLFQWATSQFPRLNVLVNNAGIQRRVSLLEPEEWNETQRELAINLEAPIHLCQLFIPYLREQTKPAIMNVSSGLAFAPFTAAPIYSATKAALHSFTLTLRQQLLQTPIEVVEVIPPAVNTDLGGVGLHNFGAPLDDFADDIIQRLSKGEQEIAYGTAQERSRASRDELDAYFAQMNKQTGS